MIEAILIAVVIHVPPEKPGQDVLGLKEYESLTHCLTDAKTANELTLPQYHRTFYCEPVKK